MCGISGIFYFDKQRNVNPELVKKMTNSLIHRGPDDEGYFIEGNIGLGQRRLAIIDLFSGKQPIYNEDKSVVVICNGEIYNYELLRNELKKKGHSFTTNTDVEVIAHLYEEEGINFPKRLEGMFAIAIWDKKKHTLLLCRDRSGIKPLYYYLDGDKLCFSSELKSFFQYNDLSLEINNEAIAEYFYYSFIPGPKTIFKNCFKVNPGTIIKINQNKQFSKINYWNVNSLDIIDFGNENIIDKTYKLIDNAVKSNLVSDVPFGCFLSGGIDSSIVAAFMSKNMDQPVKTFSIGFDDPKYNELDKARIVAESINADHHEAVLSPDIEDIIIKLSKQYDEPFADPSAIPTYLVSKMASDSVKMCLSGDGGDELFGGYTRYNNGMKNLYYDKIPFKPIIKALAYQLPYNSRGKTRLSLLSQKRYNRYADALGIMSYIGLNKLFNKDFRNHIQDYNVQKSALKYITPKTDYINQMGIIDYSTYLVDSNLQKVDRASMLNSLEVRVPLLERAVVEFAYSIPGSKKIVNNDLKIILKQVANKLLPKKISEFPKKGFSVPIKDWSRKELKPMISEIIFSKDSYIYNYLNMQTVEKIYNYHNKNKVDNSRLIWSIMNFELWAINYKKFLN